MAASAGTAIAAALESSGHVAQNQVLIQLEPLLIGLAVLAFIVACYQAFFSQIVEGQTTLALMKFIAPTLMLSILFVRVNSNGVDWQYGELEHQRRQVVFEQSGLTKADTEVSWLFAKYNELVSYGVRVTSSLVTDDRVRDQVLFTNRQRISHMVLTSEIVSPGLKALIHEGLQGKCGVWLSAARRVARGNRDPLFQGTPEYNSALTQYDALYSSRTQVLDRSAAAFRYLAELLPAMDRVEVRSASGETLGYGAGEFANQYCDRSSETAQNIDRTDFAVLDGPVSCEQIWCWTAMGLHAEAEGLLKGAIDSTVGQQPVYQELTEERRQQLLKEILSSIQRKVSPPNDVNNMSEEDPSIIPVVIAGMLLRQELRKDTRGNMRTDFAGSSSVRVSSYSPESNLTDEELRTLRELASSPQRALASRAEILAGALTLPYFQGALLFTLSLLFPFFAVLLLIPGQMRGFLLWCGAWLWVKMWDLGWALIMVVDDVLWELMPHQAIYEPSLTGEHTPITMLEAAFEDDPTFSLGMYYTVLAVIFFATPTILGQMILRSVSGATDVLIERLQWISTRMIAGIARERYQSTIPDQMTIYDIQDEYRHRALDGLPGRWDLQKRHSPVVFTRIGQQSDVHLLLPPQGEEVERSQERESKDPSTGEGEQRGSAS